MIPKNNDMRFEVTTKCNYNCVICPRDKLTRKIETMDFELFKKLFNEIINETNQYDTLTFPGMGESLLDRTLEDKIKYAKSKVKKLDVLILTNGSLLTTERFKTFEDLGVTSVRVSFYGGDPKTYSKIHRTGDENSFEKVRDSLVEISRIRKETKLLLTFNLLDGGNDGVVKDWISFWEPKADLLEVWRPHNWVDGKSYRLVQKEQLKTCGRPFRGPLQVQVDGTVNMCCFDFDGKLTLGDLKTQSLREIFSSSLFKKIVKYHNSGNFAGSGLICEICDQRNTDKSDVMIYNSKFDIEERVKMISTTYKRL
jgi:hypothetical protein